MTSGYSVMPRYDNVFGGGNYDSDDLDEWLTIQRDWQVDAGIEPLAEEEAVRVRERAARAIQAVFAVFGFPPITDAEVELAMRGYDSRDLPDRLHVGGGKVLFVSDQETISQAPSGWRQATP